jgi:hypothetical protein
VRLSLLHVPPAQSRARNKIITKDKKFEEYNTKGQSCKAEEQRKQKYFESVQFVDFKNYRPITGFTLIKYELFVSATGRTHFDFYNPFGLD